MLHKDTEARWLFCDQARVFSVYILERESVSN
jgi:hypothetical protein